MGHCGGQLEYWDTVGATVTLTHPLEAASLEGVRPVALHLPQLLARRP